MAKVSAAKKPKDEDLPTIEEMEGILVDQKVADVASSAVSSAGKGEKRAPSGMVERRAGKGGHLLKFVSFKESVRFLGPDGPGNSFSSLGAEQEHPLGKERGGMRFDAILIGPMVWIDFEWKLPEKHSFMTVLVPMTNLRDMQLRPEA